MANGQQKAQQNVDAFDVWKATQSDDDFKQITHRGQLSRVEVAKAIGCGKSALNQNPELKKALKALEDELRGRDVLPKLTETAKASANDKKEYDNKAAKQILNFTHSSSLEAENIELKAKVKELESRLERFGELSETLTEMGFMPR
jgi:predicted RNase H-like nuclease (RuvC/YqgF family)